MKPGVMLGVDGALLLLMLATRPWSRVRGRGLPLAILVAGVALSWAAPWVLIRSASTADGPIVVDAESGRVSAGGREVRYVNLEPADWKGRAVHEVAELTAWVPAEMLPVEGLVVFWRQGCSECARHLRALAGQDDGTRQFLLVQVRDDLKSSRAVDVVPAGAHVSNYALPENVEFVFTTPCEIVVRGGNIADVLVGDALAPH
jgi:hypothetical protein